MKLYEKQMELQLLAVEYEVFAVSETENVTCFYKKFNSFKKALKYYKKLPKQNKKELNMYVINLQGKIIYTDNLLNKIL